MGLQQGWNISPKARIITPSFQHHIIGSSFKHSLSLLPLQGAALLYLVLTLEPWALLLVRLSWGKLQASLDRKRGQGHYSPTMAQWDPLFKHYQYTPLCFRQKACSKGRKCQQNRPECSESKVSSLDKDLRLGQATFEGCSFPYIL